mmetsp:Transcript_10877/g.50243  ORF Transcript_10877/g.50243 Transcript_10877/m.50243 type:complete len:211 (-) Transcript_10877:844-1476(-)
MKSALTTFPPNLRPCSAVLAAAAPSKSANRTKTLPSPGTFSSPPSDPGLGITMLSIRPNFPHSSRMSSMISPYSTSSRSSSTSSISVNETTVEAGVSLCGGGAAAEASPAMCAAIASAPGSAPGTTAGALTLTGLGPVPASRCARCTVRDFSPIFIPCSPWHAVSVTVWFSYTKNPYPLLLPVSLSTTSVNDFVGPNASTSSLTWGSVRK